MKFLKIITWLVIILFSINFIFIGIFLSFEFDYYSNEYDFILLKFIYELISTFYFSFSVLSIITYFIWYQMTLSYFFKKNNHEIHGSFKWSPFPWIIPYLNILFPYQVLGEQHLFQK